MTASGERGDRLARRLRLSDAVVIGLGAMLGAGIFAAPAPAADAAGTWLLPALLVAGAVAYANAWSSARLAARYPHAGGTAVYAREQLGPFWGYLAGGAFITGKTASLAAMALTFGLYAHLPWARAMAVAVVLALTAVNVRGVDKTARLTRVLVALILLVLAVVALAAWTSTPGPVSAAAAEGDAVGLFDVLRGAALLFFAFAGYARLATLGEEVREPQRTIPRAIPLALGIVVVVYAVVLGGALTLLGAAGLAAAQAPLAEVMRAGRWAHAAPIAHVGAALASAAVLLSLLAGVSRTALALARRGELPAALAFVHPRWRTPVVAELLVAATVCVVVMLADVREAIGFSAFTVLAYYALTNAAAWTLPSPTRPRLTRAFAAFGLLGCVTLAATLPGGAVAGGVAVLTAVAAAWPLRSRRR